ncbi:DUF885 domain-containing protein [Saccharothrix coeruleofusca]|uniref:DUF885 domain-containing protein n=1 Tax=Saccharothrix coeruleofusca TaxID=33919 RepID=A0A918EBP2_9PSEU|nr:DUF885 domain-containing protein [Saccharothrix coeruleofusca]MBP2334240.1 uncharacterized protein (DUF885 family) [Saccharothrix coeruleofusca]GGP42413.1 hypothetical protein GCM10010185_12370 [Saccharothrix coeruleofusca]
MTTARELADDLFTLVLDDNPIMATLIGVPGWDDRLPDPGAEAAASSRRRALELARLAEAGDDDPVTRAVVAQQARGVVGELDARLIEHTYAEGLNAPVPLLLTGMSLVRPRHERARRDYLTRLAAIPDYLDALGRRQRASDRRPLAHLVAAAVARLDRYLADPGGDPLRKPELDEGSARERDELLAGAVRPAFARYRELLVTEIAPRGRGEDQPGLCWLPDGRERYAELVRVRTTTEHTPEQLHRTGLELLAALDREYEQIGARVFGPVPAARVRARLLADPALRWADAAEMLALAERAIARAELVAVDWFGRVPGARCAVAAVPEDDAPNAPLAYYVDPALDGSRPGTYFVNTHQAELRDRFSAEATAFHEGVPGHHFQISLAQQLTELPLLRRFAAFEAYLEGWALYAERLADEMGLYSDDVARLGMLSADSLRAARLVVDTGLHALGWSRQRAVEYLRANAVMPEVDIRSEVDRYIEAPAQALSYMVGRLELQRLRGDAQRRLGDRFDIRAFHDVVLGGGPLPLGVLADVVDQWCRSVP